MQLLVVLVYDDTATTSAATTAATTTTTTATRNTAQHPPTRWGLRVECLDMSHDDVQAQLHVRDVGPSAASTTRRPFRVEPRVVPRSLTLTLTLTAPAPAPRLPFSAPVPAAATPNGVSGLAGVVS